MQEEGAYHPCCGSCSPSTCVDRDRIFLERRKLSPLPAGPSVATR